MGGTFDPIHHGHLFAAEEARAQFGLERVVFMPCGQPPHKNGRDITPAEHRYVMVALATASNPCFEVSRVEIDRAGPSYTIDTLRCYRTSLMSGARLFFITGADAILEILTWREADAILNEAQCVAVARPGFDLSRLEAVLGRERAARVEVLGTRALDISSTEIRQRVQEGRPIRYLTPEPVVEHIVREGLYAGGREGRTGRVACLTAACAAKGN
jgi:nicotinate-nucleotide adenylyltransferase